MIERTPLSFNPLDHIGVYTLFLAPRQKDTNKRRLR